MTEQDLFDFYLVVPPGLENASHRELLFWLDRICDEKQKSGLTAITVPGGVELKAPLAVGVALNFHLKVPARILLRIKVFRCRDFTKLYKTIKKIRWNDWLAGNDPYWIVSSKQSRVKIKSRIEKTCEEAFADYRIGQQARKQDEKIDVGIYIRFRDDTCEVSLDTSGEHLHKRGSKMRVGEAPIRENLAAGLVWEMLGGSVEDLNQIKLWDPMCGSGNLLIEAMHLFRPNNERKFSFQQTPLAKQIKVKFADAPSLAMAQGSDINEKVLKMAEENISEVELSERVKVEVGDYFKKDCLLSEGFKHWMILNPPYGLRIKIGENQGAEVGFFQAIIDRAFHLGFSRVGCIVPNQFYGALKVSDKRYKKVSKTFFKNGGIAVVFLIFARSE